MFTRTPSDATTWERKAPRRGRSRWPGRVTSLLAVFAICLSSLTLPGGLRPANAQIIDIRPNGPVIDPNRRPLICAPPRVRRNGRCVLPRPNACSPPRVMRNGRCVLPRPNLCPPPRVMRNGRCVMPRPNVCAPPRVMRNGRCVRPPRPTVCRPPRVLRNGRCVTPPRRPNCRLPYVYSPAQRRCILPVPIPPVVRPQACEAPWQYSRSAGGCICPSGYIVSRGECVRRDSQSCTFPFVYSDSRNRCVCAKGYRSFGTGCKKEDPTPSGSENIRWIQACLKEAGYDAGPVDGVSGRKTRGAWKAFRSENDLGDASAPYSDPETLAKLFQACQPDEATPAEPEPEDETPARDDDAADTGRRSGDGDFAPDDALCASGRLYSLLSAENPSLEPCGRSCIPAPEGMSEEELLRQEETQGITWCRSCVSVGSLGMLCPRPAEDEDEDGEDAPQDEGAN